MKVNGNVQMLFLSVILTSTIGWGAYITKNQAQQAIDIAVVHTQLDGVTLELRRLADQLHRKESRDNVAIGALTPQDLRNFPQEKRR